MSKKGQGGGGTAKGGGKNRSSGQDVVVKKTKNMQTKAISDNILKLRTALFDETGKDRNILEGISPAFLNYDKNGCSLEISFVSKLKEEELDWAFEITKDNMEDIYDVSGYGWDDDDKERELSENGARFLLVREKKPLASSSTASSSVSVEDDDEQTGPGPLIAFVHFRFTVQGEVIDQMAGAPILYIIDLHIEEKYQRKGLGKHLLVLLELIARKQSMSRVTLPIHIGDEKTKSWLTKVTRNAYINDVSFNEIGFDADAEGFEVYSKVFAVPAPSPTAAANAAAQASVFQLAKTISEAKQPTVAATLPPALPAPTTKTTTSKSGQSQGDKTVADAADVTVDIEGVISELKALYVQEHRKDPTADMVEQWKLDVLNVKKAKEEAGDNEEEN